MPPQYHVSNRLLGKSSQWRARMHHRLRMSEDTSTSPRCKFVTAKLKKAKTICALLLTTRGKFNKAASRQTCHQANYVLATKPAIHVSDFFNSFLFCPSGCWKRTWASVMSETGPDTSTSNLLTTIAIILLGNVSLCLVMDRSTHI